MAYFLSFRRVLLVRSPVWNRPRWENLNGPWLLGELELELLSQMELARRRCCNVSGSDALNRERSDFYQETSLAVAVVSGYRSLSLGQVFA